MTTILAIESSCDETAASVIRDGKEILSNHVHTQIAIHAQYGGVVPELASRSHTERILPVIQACMESSALDLNDMDAIAVTQKPGLIGSLLVGVTAAKALAFSLEKPLIGVNHIHAHLYANTFDHGEMKFPCIGMVVSGGHTSLLLGTSPLDWEVVGETIDDAAGEAFDKVAKLLELSYPGGPIIEEMALKGDDSLIDFPQSMLGKESLDFSFSGLKTAALYACRGKDARSAFDNKLIVDVHDAAASFQKSVVSVLAKKALRALKKYDVDTLYIGGGVVCNKALRKELEERLHPNDCEVFYPSPKYCTDNAAMIGGLAYHHWLAKNFIGLEAEIG
ncbi:MAG: tRNA (adenosine(37)-N6)-threonylcarbamoyltransferase complex transferase subunit TsaD [Planctomycetota bacterium]|nr:MAG: tRNA (adenosine(37)-N6)-threonylcarbamoyltransferase complex transferase subunit TsaD [Planctomycetota bacterium]